MFSSFEERVADKVELAAKEPCGNKVMGLKEAVSSLIRPGMHLHIGHAYMRPNAAVYEICRQFWGKDPRFTVSSLGFIANMVLFVHGGLARKLITTFCGDSYPFPGPNRVYQEAFRKGRVEIENWTVLTLPQRLLAGAMGVEWMPTHSLKGSTMQEENAEDFRLVDMPGGEVGMVRALRPDLTLLHAWAADAAGNVLLTPPYAENVHASFAAREGVLVTVEEVVPTSFLRRHSHFVKIPGYLVKAVCRAPMGVHPSGASNQGIKEFDAYAEDEEFMLELREACGDEGKLEEWVREWVLSVEDHDAYLRKLGYERIWHLKGRAASDSWKSELASRTPHMNASPSYTAAELMVVEAARLLGDKIRRRVTAPSWRASGPPTWRPGRRGTTFAARAMTWTSWRRWDSSATRRARATPSSSTSATYPPALCLRTSSPFSAPWWGRKATAPSALWARARSISTGTSIPPRCRSTASFSLVPAEPATWPWERGRCW